MRRTVTIVGVLAACGAACAQPVVFKSGGTDQEVIDTVTAYRNTLGAPNGGNPGSFGTGRRDITWDGVPDNLASPNAMPGTQFNGPVSPLARGAQFSTPGDHLEVSANAVNPTNTLKDFGNIDPSYVNEFREFSAQKLFTAVGSNIIDVTFHIPGQATPALVRGFGAVFSDVEVSGATTIEFYNAQNALITTRRVPAALALQEGFSFLGLDFGQSILSRVRINCGTHALAPGLLDNVSNGVDLVVTDDFIYGEPVAVPAPGAAALLGLAGILGLRRRR
jgi:MYXO-CTERM domain-containing protein